ncbi:aminopeptidase O isoform X2 [Ascaphus truei]|uniref:aminopeptidase O isoform X2 n=1 Tax=Ascaphus truei TaxID=8439 RepID=UPI003F59A7AD
MSIPVHLVTRVVLLSSCEENFVASRMEQNADDLPLMANTSHILVKHYALDVHVCFDSQVITGNIVLFLEPINRCEEECDEERDVTEKACPLQSPETCRTRVPETCETHVLPLRTCSSKTRNKDSAVCVRSERDTSAKYDHHGNRKQASGITSSENCCDRGNHGSTDFVLVLDCCDLSVLKVEEVDVTAVPGTEKFMNTACPSDESEQHTSLRNEIISELVALPVSQWKEQLFYYTECSLAPGCGDLLFSIDTWSLQISKAGIKVPTNFPSAIRIWYKTTADGRSVKWTTDQSGRPCVYTIGSPINNRALFPCQEPPVAMSTWQATVRAATSFVVLMSGENIAAPKQCHEGFFSWFYYVTMPMPASTFTIAVGNWEEVKENSSTNVETSHLCPSLSIDDSRPRMQKCGHMKYPCRFSSPEAQAQAVIPHRIFAPHGLLDKCTEVLLPLLPQCLTVAYAVLGTHPFSRLDILIVPSNFSSLGMASPHIIYLSQSVLSGRNQLCMTRVCHEIAHAWFGLAIGARDWTEEWISEGFATHLEDVFLAKVQKVSQEEAKTQNELKALLRWRRLTDELRNSEEELQILRPHGETTGEVSDSGASIVRHGLNPEKTFMQVHYLKGYFLLQFLVNKVGQDTYFSFLRKFVNKFHGQLILSQDFLHMLYTNVPEQNRQGLTVEGIYQTWLDTSGIPKPLLDESQTWKENPLVQQVNEEVSKWIRFNQRNRKSSRRKRQRMEEFDGKIFPDQLVLLLESLLEKKTLCHKTLCWLEKTYRLRGHDAEVRHRWCELAIKHKYTAAYGDVERFLQQDQAMGVYLYGELMVNEDARQQELAHRCFAAVRDQMDTQLLTVWLSSNQINNLYQDWRNCNFLYIISSLFYYLYYSLK